MKTRIKNLLLLLLLLMLPAVAQAQDAYSTNADGSVYTYDTNADGSANIVAYAGPPWVVTIPTNINGLTVTSIGDDAFEFSSLTNVTIPNTITTIGNQAFYYCTSLTSVTIGNGVTSIGGFAFEFSSLTNVTIPNSVTSIGYGAFYECSSLTSVTIGNGVTNIGGEAFYYCTSLTSINVDASNPAYSSMNGVLFDKAQATLLQFPEGLGGSYTIPNSVTSIGGYAFYYCTSLTSVTIGNGVTNIGGYAFFVCISLTSINVDASNPAYSSMNGVLFDKAQTTLLQFPEGLGGSYTIPNSITSIGGYAFYYCTSLTRVTILNGVTNIGYFAFAYCASLTSVTIGNSVTTIEDDAFDNCTSLKSVTILDGVTSIGVDAFVDCISLTSVTFPNSVTSIGFGAFNNCFSLTSVTIPASVTTIEDDAFNNCTSLKSVYFLGNAPSPTYDSTVFFGDPATVYYLPGTTGWGSTFDGVSAVLWNPQATAMSITGGQFGFNLTGPTNAVIVVEACTNLVNPIWVPVSTNTLSGGTNYFSDPQRTNYPGRFYRISSP